MFIQTIFKEKLKEQEIAYQNAIYIYFLIQQNVMIFCQKMLMSAELFLNLL